MRICLDIDGTICELKNYIGSYKKVLPLPGVKDFIDKHHQKGDTIILYTARHMKSCAGDVGKVIARQGKDLLDWLADNEIYYDELYFGKPQADVYIDDNCVKFDGNWDQFAKRCGDNWVSVEDQFKMNIVITMAGAGSRFSKAGYEIPKPLIKVRGMPMYRYSTQSLPLELADRLVFVIHSDRWSDSVEADIRANFCDFKVEIVKLNEITRGQAETLLMAASVLNHARPTLVHNADSAISLAKEGLVDRLKAADGMLITFEAEDPRYSYAKTDQNGDVLEVREKKVISTHASTGTYYFKSTVQMLKLLQSSIDNNELERGEFYIAPIYNKMISAGMSVRIERSSKYDCYGTPEELKAFESRK